MDGMNPSGSWLRLAALGALLAVPGHRITGLINAPAGVSGAIAGAWVASRLKP